MQPDSFMDIGNELADRSEHLLAIEAFLRAKENREPGAELNLGNSYRAIGDIARAEEAFEAGWLAGDNDAGFNLASLLEDQGVESAFKIFDSLASDGYAKAAVNAAWRRFELGHRQAAIEMLKRYLDDDEVGLLVRSTLGRMYLDSGDDVEAEPLLRSAQGSDPWARVDLGHLLVRTSRSQEAQHVWRMGVENGEIESMVPLANLLSARGEIERAATLYRRAFELGDAHAALNLAADLWNSGRHDEAIRWARAGAEAGDTQAREWLADLDA